MMVAPSGNRACLRLFSGMVRPNEANSLRMSSATSCEKVSPTPATCATSSVVRSSAVGPMPPVEITTSACVMACRHAHTMRSATSPTVTMDATSRPASISLSAIWLALVSTTFPVVISSPVLRMAARSIIRILVRTPAAAMDGPALKEGERYQTAAEEKRRAYDCPVSLLKLSIRLPGPSRTPRQSLSLRCLDLGW